MQCQHINFKWFNTTINPIAIYNECKNNAYAVCMRMRYTGVCIERHLVFFFPHSTHSDFFPDFSSFIEFFFLILNRDYLSADSILLSFTKVQKRL